MISRLEGYTDADWAGYKADRRWTLRSNFSLGNDAITWSNKKQPTIALLSIEAEYRDVAIAVCEVFWLKRMLKDLGVPIKGSILLYCDNMTSVHLARNLVFHKRTKHTEVQYHFIRERVQTGDIDLQHINTNLQVADIFTKALGVDKLGQFIVDLGLTIVALPSLKGVLQPTNRTQQTNSSQSIEDKSHKSNKEYETIEVESIDHPATNRET